MRADLPCSAPALDALPQPAQINASNPEECCMTKPNGLHHLAVTTADIKAQIAFFSDVLGTELVALYWMHGVKGAWHGFVKLNDHCSIAFVQSPEIPKIAREIGKDAFRQSGCTLRRRRHAAPRAQCPRRCGAARHARPHPLARRQRLRTDRPRLLQIDLFRRTGKSQPRARPRARRSTRGNGSIRKSWAWPASARPSWRAIRRPAAYRNDGAPCPSRPPIQPSRTWSIPRHATPRCWRHPTTTTPASAAKRHRRSGWRRSNPTSPIPPLRPRLAASGCTQPPHPEERPQAASRRVGNGAVSIAYSSRDGASRLPQGEVLGLSCIA